MMTTANVSLRLDRTTLNRLALFGFLDRDDRDPASVRAAVNAALLDRLAPRRDHTHTHPAAPNRDVELDLRRP